MKTSNLIISRNILTDLFHPSHPKRTASTLNVKVALHRTNKLPKKHSPAFWTNIDNQKEFFDSIEDIHNVSD